jgi:hypothetical protein
MGVAVIPDEARIDALNAGQKVSYDVAIIESASELSSALGISASAEMRYGLFSASGSLELSEKAQYKTAATYVLARCNVENAPVQLFDPAAKESAVKLKDNPSNFRRAFGDTFVRAAIAGGQFYALLEIIHKDTQKQKSLAASIQAEYNGYIGSAEAKFEMKKETQQLTRESSFRILQYQASGQDVETTLVQDTNAVIERLKAFPGPSIRSRSASNSLPTIRSRTSSRICSGAMRWKARSRTARARSSRTGQSSMTAISSCRAGKIIFKSQPASTRCKPGATPIPMRSTRSQSTRTSWMTGPFPDCSSRRHSLFRVSSACR